MGDDKEEATGIRRIWNKHAERSSIVGLPYIQNSKNPLVKLVWFILLMAAIGGMVYHLYSLAQTYLEYEKTSTISFSFDQLQFPAITICNINPMKYPLKDKTSKRLQDVIAAADPRELTKKVADWNPSVSTDGHRNSNFFDSFESAVSIDEVDISGESTFDGSWEAESEKSTFNAVYDEFVRLYNQENITTQQDIGHNIRDFVIQASFKGRRVLQRNFTRFIDPKYGNCYTLEHDKFIARQSGPNDGLDLILNLETDEYLPGLTLGKGAQLVIHEPGSVAFPEEEGIAINGGTETRIGLRQISISRIGAPYLPDCTDQGASFIDRFGITYTRTACQRLCEQNRVRSQCGCINEEKPEENGILRNPDNLGACRTREEMKCISKVAFKFSKDSSFCDCDSPCSEVQYEKTISSRQWPGEAFASVIRDTICKDRGPAKCNALKNKTDWEMQQEFIKLQIYYNDLNYEEITEAESYEDFQFYSDFGGAVGLWIGLSLLSLCELVHLGFDIFRYLCCCGADKEAKRKEERYKMDDIGPDSSRTPVYNNNEGRRSPQDYRM